MWGQSSPVFEFLFLNKYRMFGLLKDCVCLGRKDLLVEGCILAVIIAGYVLVNSSILRGTWYSMTAH